MTTADEHLVFRQRAQRRLQVARTLYDIWTFGGSNESGLAHPLLDGRLDALGIYVTFEDDEMHQPWLEPPTMHHCHCSDLTYNEFFTRYMIPNKPVIISGLTKSWRAKQEWVKKSDKGGRNVPDLQALSKLFGSDTVTTWLQTQRGFTPSRPKKQDQSLAEFAQWWYRREEINAVSDSNAEKVELHYLKDWKFVAAHPSYEAYEWPCYFRDDWLNGAMGNAYKFVYLGPSGTCTRLHADVLRSFSWSTNVCGRKRWYLIPPWCTHLLYDCFGKTLSGHLHADVQNGVGFFFPGLVQARKYAIEVFQEEGETIFVPSGWHHTVENLEPTLSINHNWLNGTNVNWSWEKLRSELESSHLHSMQHAEKPDNVLTGVKAADSTSETEQVSDDLLLLWLVLSKKARTVMAIECKHGKMARFDLNAILPILQEIQMFITDGKDHGLTERCHCDIDELIEEIISYLKDV